MDIDMPEYDAEAVSVMRGGVGKGGREGREEGREEGKMQLTGRKALLALLPVEGAQPCFLLYFTLLCFTLLYFTLPYSLLYSQTMHISSISRRSGKRKGEGKEGKTGRGGGKEGQGGTSRGTRGIYIHTLKTCYKKKGILDIHKANCVAKLKLGR